MKRRDFIKAGAVAAGAVGSLKILPGLAAVESESSNTGAPSADNRPAEYLHRVQGDRFLPKPPVPVRMYSISPMPLGERISRKMVPQRGFCSIAPGNRVSESLISGNGAMNIELMGDPYSEQILFHHESRAHATWKRSVWRRPTSRRFFRKWQMVLDGPVMAEAMSLAAQRMNESPIKQNTEPHLTIPAFLMQLDLPKTAHVKNYLRTVNFENSEIKVAWTDEHGDWVRFQTLASRPDNVVVQWFAAPPSQPVNVRISLQKSAEWSMSTGASWGNHPARGAIKGVEAGDVRPDSNEQRLIYKCRLDPAVDSSGYAGVTRSRTQRRLGAHGRRHPGNRECVFGVIVQGASNIFP